MARASPVLVYRGPICGQGGSGWPFGVARYEVRHLPFAYATCGRRRLCSARGRDHPYSSRFCPATVSFKERRETGVEVQSVEGSGLAKVRRGAHQLTRSPLAPLASQNPPALSRVPQGGLGVYNFQSPGPQC